VESFYENPAGGREEDNFTRITVAGVRGDNRDIPLLKIAASKTGIFLADIGSSGHDLTTAYEFSGKTSASGTEKFQPFKEVLKSAFSIAGGTRVRARRTISRSTPSLLQNEQPWNNLFLQYF
jgi:hypothetical protein